MLKKAADLLPQAMTIYQVVRKISSFIFLYSQGAATREVSQISHLHFIHPNTMGPHIMFINSTREKVILCEINIIRELL